MERKKQLESLDVVLRKIRFRELLHKYRDVKEKNEIINKETGSNYNLRLLNREYKLMDKETRKGFEESGGFKSEKEKRIYFDIYNDMDTIIHTISNLQCYH